MPAVKIGVVTAPLARQLRPALRAASRAGADGVEIDLRTELPHADLSDSAVRQLRKLLDDLRLSAAVGVFPTRRGFGEPAELDRRVLATRAAMSAAKKLGAGLFLLRLGPVAGPDERQREVLEETLLGLSRHADHVGLRVALQARADNLERLPGLLDSMPDTLLGASLDPATLLADGVDAAQAVDALGPRLTHLHAADAVRDLSSRGAVPVELGRGSVEWPELLGRLEEHNYRGWAVVQPRAEAAPEEVDNAVAYLRAF